MNRTLIAIFATGTMMFTAGCATKNYVRNTATPIINKTNELDEITSRNSRDIKDVDSRAQQGIQGVQAKAASADQKAVAAGQLADQAQSLAGQANSGVNLLQTAVANLDNYRPVTEIAVHFGFDKADLTPKAKQALDQLSNDLPNTRHYIVEVIGGTDSVGPADYNYGLSQRRADAVIQYLAQSLNVPAHKIYLVGLGKDKPVASNRSQSGRARNRRVDVKLMTNTVESQASAQNQTPSTPQQPQQ